MVFLGHLWGTGPIIHLVFARLELKRSRQRRLRAQRGGVTARGDDKTRMVMFVAVVLWISAVAALFVAIRLRMKPLLFVGLLDGMLALFITALAVNSARRRRLDR